MTLNSMLAMAVALYAGGPLPLAFAAEHLFDGHWSVHLVCPDTMDKNGLVKGYDYAFAVLIREGQIKGEYGVPGHPGSVVYTGHVSDDGALEVKAIGYTGNSEYTVGKVAQGTQYAYTMHGKLEPASGQATRRELRPCTAIFSKS